MQYNAALTRTGAIIGPSQDKLYQGLVLEYLSKEDRWRDRVCSINFYQPRNHHIFGIYSANEKF